VKINAAGLEDKVFAEEYVKKGEKIVKSAQKKEAEILGIIDGKINRSGKG
jgi:formiminotetrahydrofolate cyclodeaminase